MRLPKIETLIIIAFLGSVFLWAASKCNAKRSQMTTQDYTEVEERPKRGKDTVYLAPAPAPVVATPSSGFPPPSTLITQQPTTIQQPVQQPIAPPGRTPVATSAQTATVVTPLQNAAPATANSNAKYSTLFVTIDGLKMRKEAGLKGDLVAKLDLYEQVYFLNQKTEWTQEISLGKENVTDHWVKVKTKSGKIGWVFGAGVHYYKMKRKGVLE
jgi:hypothetical protein